MFLGAGICIFYYLQLGFFPQNISASDSFIFIIFTIAFSLIYSFVVVILLTCGIFIIRPVAFVLHKLRLLPDYSDNLSIEARWGLPFLMLFALPTLHSLAKAYDFTFYIASFLCGISWYVYQNLVYKNQQKLFPTEEQQKIPLILCGIIVFIPLLVSMKSSLDLFPKANDYYFKAETYG